MDKNSALPPKTPTKNRKIPLYHDRLLPQPNSIAQALLSPKTKKSSENIGNNDEVKSLYECVLKSELLNIQEQPPSILKSPVKSPATKRIWSYKSPTKGSRTSDHSKSLNIGNSSKKLFADIIDSPTHEKYNTTPIKEYTQSLLNSVSKVGPKISKTPYKVLDAPDLQDDFYLNLVDWGHQNILSVGLGNCVYLWNAMSAEVTKLCDLGSEDTVTSVNWDQKGHLLAVGTNKGLVQLWDVSKGKKVRVFMNHLERVGTISWMNNILSSGSRDRSIHHHDIRSPADSEHKYSGHIQEVCGLKWNPLNQLLASGGNDNNLIVWDWRLQRFIYKFTDHVAAIKAISWNPVQNNILASGGGTADRTIRFWNTSSGSSNLLRTIDTGSQVCNVAWSKTGQELVSTHGYSQNQINIWKYNNMETLATLTGHSYRVLYLSMSPDGQNIVTGAGDETLRFWNVFTKRQSKELDSFSRKLTLR